jgi:capping protein alpha
LYLKIRYLQFFTVKVMYTTEEKVEAAGTFLVQAPLGEFNEVRKLVAKLLNDDKLFKKACEVLPAHFEYLRAPVRTGKEPPYVLLSETTRLEDGVYACAQSGNAYTIDYSRKAVRDCRELTDDEKGKIGVDDELRISIEKALLDYVNEHHDKYGKYSVIKTGDRYYISVHSDRYRPENFWSGTWVAKAELEPLEEEYNLNLETLVSVHYFEDISVRYFEDGNPSVPYSEDGNVQLNTSSQDVVKIGRGEDNKVAEEAIGALNKFLVDFHSSVSDFYVNMKDSTFKKLRRQLPITKTKIEWDKPQSYTLVKDAARSNADNNSLV